MNLIEPGKLPYKHLIRINLKIILKLNFYNYAVSNNDSSKNFGMTKKVLVGHLFIKEELSIQY
jgi:hypothetical protein